MDNIDIHITNRGMKNPFMASRFRDIRVRILEPEDHARWEAVRNPVLAALRICGSGLYAGAHQHRCRRVEGELQESVLIYCIGGEGYGKLNGHKYPVKAGDLLYCPAGSAHEYGAATRDPWTIW